MEAETVMTIIISYYSKLRGKLYTLHVAPHLSSQQPYVDITLFISSLSTRKLNPRETARQRPRN